jgi:hypothetical protein
MFSFSGKYFALFQEIKTTTDFPFGMDRKYLSIVKPTAILRTWISHSQSPKPANTNHWLNISVSYSTDTNGVLDSKTQTLSTSFSNQIPTNASDMEFSMLLNDFADFD